MSRDSNEMRAQSAKTCAKARSRSLVREQGADVAKPGAGKAEGQAARERGPEYTEPPPHILWGPQISSTAIWGPAGEAASAH